MSSDTRDNIVAMDYNTAALDRKFKEKEDVMHLANIYAAREKEYWYTLKENNELKYAMNKQRILVINHYDEILNSLDSLKQELEIKDLKIIRLMDDINLLKIKKDQNGIKELFGERITEFSENLEGEYFDNILNDSKNRNELNECKLLIAEEINQLKGSSDIVYEVENYRMPDLINMILNIIRDKAEHFETINNNLSQYVEDHNQLFKEIDNYKEWQERLESENGRLTIEIENHKFDRTLFINKENEYNDLKKEYSQLLSAYDKVNKKNVQLKSLVNHYKEQLAEKEINCVDSDNIIKTLNLNLNEQTNKLNQTIVMYNNEKAIHKKNESYVQQMVEDFTDRIQEKNVEIEAMQNECSMLKQINNSAEEEIQNLRDNVMTLEYVLSKRNEKNKTYQEKKELRKHQSLMQFNDFLHVLSTLEQQMNIMLEDMFTCKKKITRYESVLHNMQNAIQQQCLARSGWIAKHENIKKKYDIMKNEMGKKHDTLLEHQVEVDNLKKDYNLRITSLVDTEIKLRLEIQDLKKKLDKKNSFLITAEKLASLQLFNATNQINNLTRISTIQSLEINDMKEHISIMQRGILKPKTKDTRYQIYRECSIDIMKKVKQENRILLEQCKIRDEKIKYLENNRYCNISKLRHFN
ncbi:golgin subfamily B member 1-like [Sipha flava]|uniref:Golgin subfamily B member 1-like n=1 Tax=Sipha flava TaxID=143950 RepID=A0A2S2QSF0_9HEMI|nr:golgin subfamily B member 1-like [Sipha flava]